MARIAAVAAFMALSTATAAGQPWYTLDTEHFAVHFPEGYQELALEVAEEAERIYPVVSARAGHHLDGKTHVVLQDAVDLANGFAQPVFYHQITLFTVPPVGYPYDSGIPGTSRDWAQMLVTHEYVHAVHLDMAEGIYAGLRRFFGHVPLLSTPNLFQNFALIEGYATYEETVLSQGRGAASFFDMFLRAGTLERRLLTPDQAAGRYDLERWAPGGTVYLYGYSWQAYLAERFGDATVARAHKIHAASGPFSPPGSELARATGTSLRDLYEGWLRSLEERYRAQQADIEARGVTSFDVHPAKGWVVMYPRYSPDGTRLAYQTSGGPVGPSVRSIDLASGEDRPVAEGALGAFDWTPDGRFLVYAILVPADGGARQLSDLMAVELATRRTLRLSRGLRALAPAVSPDGTRVAFIQMDGTHMTAHVAVAPLRYAGGREGGGAQPDGLELGEPRRWVSGRRDRTPVALAWEPRGERLAVAWYGGGRSGIDLVSGPGSAISLVDEAAHVASPSFTADGQYLLFESDRTGVSNLYAYHLERGELHQITNVVNGAFFPTASPDGTRLAFAAYTADGYVLATMPLDPHVWRSPDPPFRGGHWQLAAWREQAGDPWEQARQVDRSTLSVRPYSAFETLVPTWWLPLLGMDENGLALGAMTAMGDARMQHSYSVTGAYHTATGRPFVAGSYVWQADPLFGTGLSSGLAVEYAGDEQFSTVGHLVYRLDRSPNVARPVVDTLRVGVQAVSDPSASSSPALIPFAGWHRDSAWGVERTLRFRSFGLDAERRLRDNGALTLTGRWVEGVRWRLGGKLSVTGTAGVSQEDGLTLGPSSVRGLQKGEGGPGASSAYLLSLEGEIPLARIYRGLGLWPVFLGRLSGAAFTDIGVLGAKASGGEAFWAASVGVEARLDVHLQYEIFRLTPWVGAAYVLGTGVGRPGVRLMAGVGL